MKTLYFGCLIATTCLLFLSCKKGEVPDTNAKYIGVWKNTSDTTNVYRIVINADGRASYNEQSAASNKNITGYVFFDGYNFKIGTKNFVGEKFKTNSLPQHVTISVDPYKYYTIATFNGINFKTIEN
jgi:hypothetical protein